MADLSKVRINGADYDLKDETARQNSGGNADKIHSLNDGDRHTVRTMVSFIDDDCRSETYSKLFPAIYDDENEVLKFPYALACPPASIGGSGYMTQADLLKMYNAGVNIVCHHRNQYNMDQFATADAYDADLTEALEMFKGIGISDVCSVAYPQGQYLEDYIRIVKKHFKMGFTVERGINQIPYESFYMKRCELFPTDGSFTLDDAKELVDQLAVDGGWLIFMTHAWYEDTFDTGKLLELAEYIQETKQIPIVGVNDAIKATGNVIDIGHFRKPLEERTEPFFVVDANGKTWTNSVNIYDRSGQKITTIKPQYHTESYLTPSGNVRYAEGSPRIASDIVDVMPGETYLLTCSSLYALAAYVIYLSDGTVESHVVSNTEVAIEGDTVLTNVEKVMPENATGLRVMAYLTNQPNGFEIKKVETVERSDDVTPYVRKDETNKCNPRDFGAVGDGVTDDTEAIRSCINYANEHGLDVKFDRGKWYKVNQATKIVAYCSIDFNYSTIILSGGSTDPFINVAPIDSKTYTLLADSLTENSVSNAELFNKCITIVTPINLGVRNHETATEQAYVQTMMTDMNGNFINGKLECEIVDGTYTIRNAHDYRIPTLEIKNVTVDYSEIPDYGTAVFIDSIRSNVKFDNITMVGDVIINEWSRAVLGISNSCNIEVSNIRGNSPYSNDGSGYIIGLYEVADVYLHDCDFGGSTTQWGCIGVSYISNYVIERLNVNRIDCHYYFTGYFIVRDSTAMIAKFCGGNGIMAFERVNFINSNVNENLVVHRNDLNIVPSGTVKFSECIFEGGANTIRWDCLTSPDTDLLTKIKYDFTHFVFENCKVDTTGNRLSYFELASGWDNILVDVINCKTGSRTVQCYGESKIKRAIIKGCTFIVRSEIDGCNELIIKECHGDTINVRETNNSCVICDNVFTPANTTTVASKSAIVANNVILADRSLVNNATKYIIANNLPLYDTYKSTWANASK